YSLTLSRALCWSCSRLEPPRETPMIGKPGFPRLIIQWRAGKIFLYARSPVAPNRTRASEWEPLSFIAPERVPWVPPGIPTIQAADVAAKAPSLFGRGSRLHRVGERAREDRLALLAQVIGVLEQRGVPREGGCPREIEVASARRFHDGFRVFSRELLQPR